MKTLLSAFALLFAVHAQAERYPVLETYVAHAQVLLDTSASAATPEQIATLQEGTRQLVLDGVEVMKLYASKNPVCAPQFEVFLSEVSSMESKTVAELHARYHNGEGLPAAPRHCYFGRSQVVHPAMNIVRLKGDVNAEREQIQDDFAEVIEHNARIQKNLDNPPN